MTVATAEDLLMHELKDLYYVEQKLQRVLVDVSGIVEDKELSNRLRRHSDETATHAKRLEEAFGMLGEQPKAEQCPGFDGIKQEYDDFVAEEQPVPAIFDLFVAGATGGRIERYEIAGYTTAISLAERCGFDEVATLLGKTLREEQDMLADAETIAEQLEAPGVDGDVQLEKLTVSQLQELAAKRGIQGRSAMNKDELVTALQMR